MVDQTLKERVLANVAESQAARESSNYRNPDDLAQLRKRVRAIEKSLGLNVNKNEEQRILVITKKQFKEYQIRFFKKLEVIEKFLETVTKNQEAAKRIAEEANIEENQSRPGEPQRDRTAIGLRARPGVAAGLAFVVGAIIGNIERIIDFFTEGFNGIRTWVQERIQSVVDWVSNIVGSVTGAVSGAATNLMRMAPAALALGPAAIPALGAAAATGAMRGAAREPNVPSQSPEPNIATTTSMPTPQPPPIAPAGGLERQRLPRGGTVAPGVRRGSERQRRMMEAVPAGYTVSSGHRHGSRGGHGRGFAIDVQDENMMNGGRPTREQLIDLWNHYREEFPGLNVDVLYEPEGQYNPGTGSTSTGNHIHIEVARAPLAVNSIRLGSERVHAQTPRVQETPAPAATEREPAAPRSYPKALERSADEYDTDVKQVVIKHPPQVVTENKLMDAPREKEYAPKHIDLMVRNPFDGINAIREQASTVKW